jgi:hypothetical protein
MSLYGVGLAFALLFLGGIYLVVATRVWRGGSALDGNVPPAWWFLGDAAWRGNARAYVATVPFLLAMLAGAAIAEWSGSVDAGMALAAVSLAAGVLVHVAIVLFNRPRALVPPHLRDEPGALAERRLRKQRLAR